MRIIDKYILKQIFLGYLLLLLTFVFLYVIIDIFAQLQDILRNKTSIFILFKYYLFFMPQIFLRVSPLSFLISSLYCIGILNKNNEIISLRTQGLSIFGISKLFIMSSLFLSVLSLFVEDRIVPRSFIYFRNIEGYRKKSDFKKEGISNFAFYAAEGFIIFAKKFDFKENSLTGVNIFIQNSKGNISQEILADKLIYKDKKWFLKNAFFYELSKDKLILGSPHFLRQKQLNLSESPQQLFEKFNLDWESLSLKDLNKQIFKFSLWKAKKIITLLKVEFHKKIALSFSLLFLLLGSLPFALKIKKRRVGLSSLGLAILMTFLYYLIFSLGSALGRVGFFSPWIGCWLPNIFFGISGITGLLSLR